jgi:hypothetical protein
MVRGALPLEGNWCCRPLLCPSAIATARLVLPAVGVASAIANAGLAWDYIFIFIDPCAGRHLLSLASVKESKQRKALYPTSA